MILVSKGREASYGSILHFVRAIDLSNNNLSGEIPETIMSPAGLGIMNHLTGKIPLTVGNLKMLRVP